MAMTPEISLVRPSETGLLRVLAEETFLEAFSADNTPENMASYVSKAFTLEQISSEYENGNSDFYFARVKSSISGYLKLNRASAQTEQEMPGAIEIERIYVRQSFQGKGVGQALISKAVLEARKAGAPWLWLAVWEKNTKAIAFYKAAGFEVFGGHDFYLGEDLQHDFMMRLKLGTPKL